jgi:protein-L-isoaspartate O-methyltransferase
MTVMGDGLPEKWSDELQREGRVIFPIRAAAVWLTSPSPASSRLRTVDGSSAD